MYCPKCGTLNENEARFCKTCSVSLDEIVGKTVARTYETFVFAHQPSVTSVSLEKYAGFWIRFLSSLIDGAILSIINFTILFAILLVYDFFLDRLVIIYLVDNNTSKLIIYVIIYVCNSILYNVWMLGKYGQTLGKMAFSIKVLQFSGQPMTYKKAFVRWLSSIVNIFTLGIGYLMIAFKKNKRGLHDVIANTKVVYVGKPNIAFIVIVIIFLLGGIIFRLFLFYKGIVFE